MVSDYKLKYTGQETDSYITLCNTALQHNNLTSESGSSTSLAITQSGATALYEKIYNGEQEISLAANLAKTINNKDLNLIINPADGQSAILATDTAALSGTIGKNVEAVTQPAGDNSQKVATTEFVTNAISSIAQVDERSMNILLTATTVTTNKFYRQINFVYGNLDFSFANTHYSNTSYLHVAKLGGNLPKTTISAAAKLYPYDHAESAFDAKVEISPQGGFVTCILDPDWHYYINRIQLSFAYEITAS